MGCSKFKNCFLILIWENLKKKEMLKLVKIHEDLPTEILDSIKDQCVKILNYEWPRNELLRYRTLNSSKESFPMCIALVKIPENVVIGHVKLSEIPSNRSAVYIESVVIHPDLRGQGIGKSSPIQSCQKLNLLSNYHLEM